MTEDRWAGVAFSNESKFNLVGCDVKLHKDERLKVYKNIEQHVVSSL